MPLPPLRLISLAPVIEKSTAPCTPAEKPSSCRNCRLNTLTTGITLDHIPDGAKIILLFLAPSRDEINLRKPLAGGMGYFIMNLAKAAGFKPWEVGVSYIFRCYAGSDLRDRNGKIREAVIHDGLSGCRAHDWSRGEESTLKTISGGVRDWGADVYIATFEASKGFIQPAFALLTRNDLKKARELADTGRKPCVVFGSAAMKAIMPWTNDGGLKLWRGSAEEFTWTPKVDRVGVEVPEVFKQSQGWRGRKRR